MNIPRMWTIKECAKAFCNTGLTEYRIRQLALSNQIVNIRAGNKILINADKLIEYLNKPTETPKPQTIAKIRRIDQ